MLRSTPTRALKSSVDLSARVIPFERLGGLKSFGVFLGFWDCFEGLRALFKPCCTCSDLVMVTME